MTLQDFLKLPFTNDFHILNAVSSIDDIPIENISLLEPPVEKFVRNNEIILTQALTVRDDPDALKQFIEELYQAGASAVVFAFPGNTFSQLAPVLDYFAQKNFPLISMDWDHLFSEVVELTLKEIWKNERELQSYLENIQRELLSAFIQGKSLDDAAEVLYKYLGSDFVILDINHKIVGRSRGIRHLTPAGYLESRTGEIERMEIATTGRQYGYVLLDKTVFSLTFHDSTATQCINTPLTLWFDREYSIMASRLKSKEDFVWKLAHHEFESLPDINSKAEILDLSLAEGYRCIVAFVSENNSSNVMIEELALKLASDYKLSCLTALHHSTLVIFLEDSTSVSSREIVEQYIDELEAICLQNITGIRFMWGYDMQRRSLDSLNIGYKNAKSALQSCIDSNGRMHKKCFQMTITEKASSLLRKDAELVATANSILNSLIQYDARHGTEYLDTLSSYMDQNYNVSETARVCNLHRQTLIYRLDKIEDLTGLSLKNHEDLLTLQICQWLV